MEAARVDGLL